MNIELKPCPFCGGEVFATPEGECVEIVCQDCQLTMWQYTFEQLENMWNRRIEK